MSAALSVRTHLGIERRLVGEPLALDEGRAEVALETLAEMAADPGDPGGAEGPGDFDTGKAVDAGRVARLVHGGFVFGLADYAAMLAVNHPNVVLAGAEVRFLKPVVVGERLVATARLAESAGRRRRVEVEVVRGGEAVFAGTFHCAVPDRHVLAPPGDPAPGETA